ncbi:MAG: BON domain-containing protein [Chloroflexi bacterium]|nr:BON domain-containing protein [Chloroflexota bacterium]
MYYREPPEAGIGSPGPPAGGYPPERKADKDITAAVEDAFFLDPDLPETQFRFRTENGIVYLSGFATSEDEMRRAVDVALGVEGVREVINEISVAGHR